MKLTLFLIALLLVAGAAVWFGRSGTGSAPVLPEAAAASGATTKESAQLESETAGRTSASDPAAQPAGRPAATTAAPAPPQPVDPSVIATGLDGGMPSEASGGDMTAFETKYAGASKDELKANYDALQVLYQENKDGRVEDKERVLAPEALSELEREIAWLKEKAFGGG